MAKETKKEACRPREVNKEEYERGIAQITASQSSTSTGHATPAKHHDALQPVSALGAFPLVRSTQASQLPSLVKGVYKQVALYTGIWATLTVAFLPTLQGLSVVLTGGLLSTFLFHHSMRKLQTYQEEEESARFDARSEAIEKSGLPESVEWLNGMIEGIWPRIPADMFSSVADMLEDTIQANLPSFLTEVKCAELTQGKNPLRGERDKAHIGLPFTQIVFASLSLCLFSLYTTTTKFCPLDYYHRQKRMRKQQDGMEGLRSISN